MTRLLVWITSWRFVGFVGIVLVAMEIWALGPLLAIGGERPLESPGARQAAIVVLALGWVVYHLVAHLRARRRNRALIGELVEQTEVEADAETASAEEVAQLRADMTEALHALRSARLGGSRRRWLYQLPWYILIGPPGVGKTTALTNSGLSFPIADRFGPQAVRGIGGTRHCDWWFTDEAVLIDTAGRYTTQDSRRRVDSAAWLGFLDLLCRRRPLQPINGAILTLSLGDLATLPERERLAHALAARQRIKELEDKIGRPVPIYVLFTKADLIAGFSEFFEEMDPGQRQQVWGFTVPMPQGKRLPGFDIGMLQREFDLLAGRLNDRLLERMNQEPDRQRRALIFGFPAQFAALRPLLSEMLVEIFRPGGRPAFVRGVYFTSATQDGTPIDRLFSSLSALFRLDPGQLGGFRGQGRAFFLTGLFRDLIFPEAEGTGRDPASDRRRQWSWRMAALGTGLLLLIAAGVIGSAYISNRSVVSGAAAASQTVADARATVIDPPVASPDVTAVAPLLDRLSAVSAKTDGEGALPGLSQAPKLAAAAGTAYQRALDRLLLPRLILGLEQRLAAAIQAAAADPGVDTGIEDLLAAYLMLGGEGPVDPARLEGTLAATVDGTLPGHIHVLADRLPTRAYALDAQLIDAARAALTAVPPVERRYARLIGAAAGPALHGWTPADHAGPDAAAWIGRASGRPLTEGVPGAFTAAGFGVVRPLLASATRGAAAEAWLLGAEQPAEPPGTDEDLRAELLRLYRRDAGARWSALLADLTIAMPDDLDQARAIAQRLAAPDSPLLAMLRAAAAEAGTLARLLESAEAPTGEAEPADPAVSRLDAIAALDAPAEPGAEPPVARLAAALGAVSEYLRRIPAGAEAGDLLAAGAGGEATTALTEAAAAFPGNLGRQLAGFADAVTDLTAGGLRDRLQARWAAEGLPACQAIANGAFPALARGESTLAPEAFGRLFAAGGVLDAFYRANLQQAVDPATGRWRPELAEGGDGFTQTSLLQFQRAGRIGAAYQATASGVAVDLQIVPILLAATATQAVLQIDGQTLTYAHGPPVPLAVRWIPAAGSTAGLTLQPDLPGETSAVQASGPWALLQLLAAGRIAPGADGGFEVTFLVGSRIATFGVTAPSGGDPLHLQDLRDFQCPPRL